jgi:hypothetical protein
MFLFECARWSKKAGLSLDRSYTNEEVTEALRRTDFDVVEKMAIRAELADRALIRASAGTPPRGTLQAATREMHARAEPTRPILRNPDGSARTLTFT